jgi:hypothetical protein
LIIPQVWNNHSDTAILFDANGLEIDRYSYPHERMMGNSAKRRKILIRNEDGFEIVNDALHRSKKVTRKQNDLVRRSTIKMTKAKDKFHDHQ